jgi:hypothetical protein
MISRDAFLDHGRSAMKGFFAACAMLALLVPALALATGKVSEAKLGKSVVNRQVGGETSVFSPGERAYLWMKVYDATGKTLTVTWEINGHPYPAKLKIGGSPWRTWASKTLHIAGEWTVIVTDAAGASLSERKFTVK